MNDLDVRTTKISVSAGWLDAFAADLAEHGRSERTIQAYCQDVRSFAAWFERTNGEAFSPELVTGVDLRAYRSWSIAKKIAPKTWNRRRIALSVFCTWAVESRYLNYNPFQGIDVYEEEEPAPRWLDETEYHRLIRQVEQAVNGSRTEYWTWQAVRDQAMVSLMLYAGLRVNEVAELAVSDILLTERKGKVTIRQGKGQKFAEVPLNMEARSALRLWLAVSGRTSGPLFVGKGGESVSVKLIQNRVAAIRQAAGLDDEVTPHALRHTFCKRLLDAGQPLTVVQKLARHARLETTARYVTPGWKDLENAVEGI